MANDKDFVVKEGIDVGGATVPTLGTISSSNEVDLSTGNKFAHTPGGAVTYTFSNPGQVQTFDMQLTGGQEAVASSFNTTTYTGTGAAATITNNIDLSGEGGLVWTKHRNGASQHALFDTERGVLKGLASSSQAAEANETGSITAFNSNGYTLGSWSGVNGSSNTYVSWTFRKTTKFFDVVTYSGTGSARTLSHNLGSVPGMIVIKRLDTTSDWNTYHRSLNGGTNAASYFLSLNDSGARGNSNSPFNGTAPTSSVFSLGGSSNTNNASGTYVAYLFGHETDSDSMIQCGSFTGNGSATGPTINLGWAPQWLMIRNEQRTAQWRIFDTVRGFSATETRDGIFANSSAAEDTTSPLIVAQTSTGFQIKDTNSQFNHNGENIIYVAIRAASATTISWPNSVQFTSGSAPQIPALNEVDNYTFSTRDGGTTYTGIQTGNNLS